MHVSIVLPTYNRSHFLPGAFAALAEQTYTDWDLIIVDDGSRDDTQSVLQALMAEYPFSVTTLIQDNAGPAQARNTGLRQASGELVAFFDSDDTWDPEHLALAVSAFKKDSKLDWLYFACRRIEHETGEVLLSSTFYGADGLPNPLFNCVKEKQGDIHILNNDDAAYCQILEGIDSGLQNSVIRRYFFERFQLPDFRIGEDRLIILQALCAGFSVGFIDTVTVNYYVHSGNSSDTNINEESAEKRIKAMRLLLASYEATPEYVSLTPTLAKALKARLSEDYFWKLGYSLLLADRQYCQALQAMTTGIRYQPTRFKYWKTLGVTVCKMVLGR